jgi:hypothetical protein
LYAPRDDPKGRQRLVRAFIHQISSIRSAEVCLSERGNVGSPNTARLWEEWDFIRYAPRTIALTHTPARIEARMSFGQKGKLPAVLAYTWPDEGVDISASTKRPARGRSSTAVNQMLGTAMGIQPPKMPLGVADQRRVGRVSHPRVSPPSPQPSAAEELASLKEQQQALARRISEVQEELGLQGDQDRARAAGAKDVDSTRFAAELVSGNDRKAPMGPNAEARSPTAARSISPVASPKSQRQNKPADVQATLSALFCMHPRESKEGAPAPADAPWSGVASGLEKMFRPPSFGLKDLAERSDAGLKDLAERSGLKKPSAAAQAAAAQAAQAEALRRGASADLSPEAARAEAMRHRRSDTLSADQEVTRPKSPFEKAKSIGDMGLGTMASMFEKAKSSMSKDSVEGDSPHRLNPLSPHWVPSPVVPSPGKPAAGASQSGAPSAAEAASQPWTHTPPPLPEPARARKAAAPVGAVAQVARNTPACYLLFTEASGGALTLTPTPTPTLTPNPNP